MIRAGSPPRLTNGGPGVSRFDLACDSHCREDTAALIRRWGRDRALTPGVVEDLCRATCTVLAHGARLGPSSVCVRLRWADPDHVRVDVQWDGLEAPPRRAVAEDATRAMAQVMDDVAVRWGVEDGSTPGQWMIVDTRSVGPRPAPPSR